MDPQSGTHQPPQPTRPAIIGRLRARPVLSVTLATVALAGIGVVLWWFQPQALLFDTVVDEEFPSVDAADRDARPNGDMTTADGGMDDDVDMGDTGMDDDAEAMDDDTQADTPVALATGAFVSRNRYTVEGDATTYELPDGSRVLRLEDFESTNGPDLFVYLTVADAGDTDVDLDADAIDLGMLTGNVGDQNYDVPSEVDLDRYDTVVIWCRRFTTSFGAADLRAS